MRLLNVVVVFLGIVAVGCGGPEVGPAAGGEDVRTLIDQSRFADALRVLEAQGGQPLLHAIALAGRARQIEPRAEPVPGPAAVEARQALEALGAQAEAQLALGRLLAPHAVAAASAEASEAEAPPGGPGAPDAAGDAARDEAESADTEPSAAPVSTAEVVAAFQAAAADKSVQRQALEDLIAFCGQVGCNDAVKTAYGKLLEANPQDRDLPGAYGAFLHGIGDREAALDQYGVALIWHPDDPALKAQVADVHLDVAFDHLEWGEYLHAEKALEKARTYLTDTNSAQWKRYEAGRAGLRGR